MNLQVQKSQIFWNFHFLDIFHFPFLPAGLEMWIFGLRIVVIIRLGIVQPEGPSQKFQVQFLNRKDLPLRESCICSQHGHISFSGHLILLVIVFDRVSDQTFKVMQRIVSNVHWFQYLSERIINDVLVDHLEVGGIITNLLCIIWFDVMQHQQRNTTLVESGWTSHSVSIIGDCGRYVK